MSADRLEHALDAIGWLKEFARMIPEGYIRPAVDRRPPPPGEPLGSYAHSTTLRSAYEKDAELDAPKSVDSIYKERAAAIVPKHPSSTLEQRRGLAERRLRDGGLLVFPPERSLRNVIPRPAGSEPGGSDYGVLVRNAQKGIRRHEITPSVLQQRRGGPPKSIASAFVEELAANKNQFLGKKSPNRSRPLADRIKSAIRGAYRSTKYQVDKGYITKWFERADYQAALDEARNRTDRNPTEGQKKAGNYRKGSLSFQGIPVTLENPRGSIRRGVDDDGKPWGNEMHADYGYIPRTKGKDGDQVDVFLGPSHRSQLVVAIDQHKGESFDETKFILGCDTREQAERLYLSHYPKDWKLGPVSTCTIEQFKEWLSLSHPGRMGHMKQPFRGQQLKALGHNPAATKDFAGLIPEGYSTPYVAVHHDSNRLADHTSAGGLLKKHEKESQSGGQSVERQYRSQGKSDVGVSKLERGGRITIPSKGIRPPEWSRLGKIIRSYSGGNGTLRSHLGGGSRDVVPDPYQVARKALRRHEIVHSLLQQRRGGAPDTVSKLAGEELVAYRKQLFGRKSPAKHLPASRRIAKLVKGTIASTVAGKKNLGLTKWFEELTAREQGMKQFEKPFLRYSAKRHARTGGLNDSFREKYNRENGSHLQRPVTEKPSELKPGSKAAKRRDSFCARMGGVHGPTSKDGKLTPKGAALKRWNCSALLGGIKLFSRTPEEERHELLKTGILSTGLAAGLALGARGLRGTVGEAEKLAIKRSTASKIATARRNARVAGEARAAEGAKAAKVAAKDRYRAGNASFQNLARNPNLTKGEKEAVRRTHAVWKQANPGKEFSADRRERSGSEKLRDGAIAAGALAAGGGVLHAGLKVGKAADEVTPTAKAIRAVLAHGEQAAGNFRKGWLGRLVRLSAQFNTAKHFEKNPKLQKKDEELLKNGPLRPAARQTAINSAIPGVLGAGYGALGHALFRDKASAGSIPEKWRIHAAKSSRGKYALIGAAAAAAPSMAMAPMDYLHFKRRRDGLKKYPKSIGEQGKPGYTESYPQNHALPTLKAYFGKPKMFGRLEDEDTTLHKAGRMARTTAIGGLAGRVAAWHPVHGGRMNRGTLIGAGLGALAQGASEHIASAKTGIRGNRMKVTDESRRSVREIGKDAAFAGLAAAGISQRIKAQKDRTDDMVNQIKISMTGKADPQYAAKVQAKSRRAQGLEGETFIPRMPKFASIASKKSGDEIGGDLETKLARLARAAKGTPEGDVALRKLNVLRSKKGNTIFGKLGATMKGVPSFVRGFAKSKAPKTILGHLMADGRSMKTLNQKNFALRTEEDGIPYTGRVNRDRFVKQVNESDLDRRDRNMDRAAWGGTAAGWLTHGKGSTIKQRLIRAGLGAGAGVGGVLAIRAATNKKRDIYGDRPRWAKRAEALPAVAGVGLAGALVAKKAKLFARGDYVRKLAKARPSIHVIGDKAYEAVLKKDIPGYSSALPVPIDAAHRQVPVFRKVLAKHIKERLRASSPSKEFAIRDREDGSHQVLKAGISGAASGALLGGGTALLTRGKSIKSALRAAGIGAGAMGALAGGGTALGNKVLGNPDPSDRAAFTKRAAVGGALAGAAIGGLGAVALKKGMLGPKIAAGFSKGAKTWRPLHAIESSRAPVAAAVGAGAGALYGAHQGADEGMMVDAINNSRLAAAGQDDRTKKNLGRRIKGALKEFGYSSQLRERDSQRYVSPTRAALGLHGDLVDASGNAATLGTYQTARGFYNKAKGIHKWGGRATNLLRDTGDVMAGRGRRTDLAGRPQRREWEKSWFHRAVGTAATGAALLGGAALTAKTRLGQKHILPQVRKIDATARKHGISLFAAKLRKFKQFDLDAALAGWDVRDARGKSARVFAPGSRPRFRRQKEWHEKKENREALLKGAIVGTGLIGAAAGVAATRKLTGLPIIPKLAKKAASAPAPKIVPMSKKFAGWVPKQA
jgi:hypothetical protein